MQLRHGHTEVGGDADVLQHIVRRSQTLRS